MDHTDQLRKTTLNFSFEKSKQTQHGFRRLLVQLFGFLGHGKSSFINSCEYVLKDGEEYKNIAQADSSDWGRTTERVTYKLTDAITLVDNRGCATMNSHESGEIFAQLANLLPLDTRVEWSRGFQLVHRIVEAETEVQKSDFIFPVFLYSVKMGIHEQEVKELKHLLLTAGRLTGIFPFVVLTHKTHGGMVRVESMFRDIGAEHIFSLENYTPKDNIKTRGRHEDVLRFFQEIIREVQFLMTQARDPVREFKDRKEFVLKFIYDYEMKSHQSQQEAKKEAEKVYQEIQKKSLKIKAEIQIEEERRIFDEHIKKLEEKYQLLRQADALRFREEMRQFQRELGKTKKKETCRIQ